MEVIKIILYIKVIKIYEEKKIIYFGENFKINFFFLNILLKSKVNDMVYFLKIGLFFFLKIVMFLEFN